ncbi:phospho-N-acetylmuramoyl-pentapeptide-transferase [bacterium]|nr:MAG: phospho-N-acetylmuramoyl-pentapeptide-transferase [bacterium]
MSNAQTLAQLLSSPFIVALPLWIFAWVLMLFTGSGLIRWLKALKGMKWSPREDTPDSHLQKAGTPSMGGLGIIGSAALSCIATGTLMLALGHLALSTFTIPYGWYLAGSAAFLLCVLAHCALGFADDWLKARGKGGLTSKAKLAGQIILAFAFLGIIALMWTQAPPIVQRDEPHLAFHLGIYAICFLLIIGTSNAVNLTDGIDGLAAGLSVQVGLVFGLLFLETWGQAEIGLFASAAEMVWIALGGACLGFLAFNKNPAKVFMGDTGSLALGAALGAGAILTRSVFLLPFIGFMFYIEMFSVMGQVAYFKYTKKKTGEGKRIFRRAPLHHHYELGGWSEWRVVGTFWAINALTTIIGLILWKLEILPRFPW